MAEDGKKTIIVVPTYNERENIQRLIPEVLGAGKSIVLITG